LATTYYHSITGVRFLSATRTDLSGSDNTSIVDFSADNLIIAIHLKNATAGKNPALQTFSLQWRNITDAPGSWIPLGNTGELTYNATTDLVDGTTVQAAGWKCTADGGLTDETDGVEREGSNADVTIDLGPDAETEYHIAVDFSGADKTNGDQYGFQIVDSTESQTLSITPTVTVTEDTSQSYPRTVAGSLPAQSGVVSRKSDLHRPQAGSFDMGGVVSRQGFFARSVAGEAGFSGDVDGQKIIEYTFTDEDVSFEDTDAYEWTPHEGAAVTVYYRNVDGAFSLGPGESARAFSGFRKTVGDQPSASGVLGRQAEYARNQAGQTDAAGEVVRKAIFPRAEAGEFDASGELSRQATLYRYTDGQIDSSGEVARQANLARSETGAFDESGELSRKAIFRREPSGDFDTYGEVNRQTSLFRSLSGAFGFSGTVNRYASYFRSVLGSLPGATGVVNGVIAIFRDVAGAFSMTGTVARKVFYNRSVSGSEDFSGTLSRFAQLFRSLTGQQSFNGEVSRKGVFQRAASGLQSFSGIVAASVESGMTLYQRTVAGAIGFSGQLYRSLQSVIFKDEHVIFEDEDVTWEPKEAIGYDFYEKDISGDMGTFAGSLSRIVIFKRSMAGVI